MLCSFWLRVFSFVWKNCSCLLTVLFMTTWKLYLFILKWKYMYKDQWYAVYHFVSPWENCGIWVSYILACSFTCCLMGYWHQEYPQVKIRPLAKSLNKTRVVKDVLLDKTVELTLGRSEEERKRGNCGIFLYWHGRLIEVRIMFWYIVNKWLCIGTFVWCFHDTLWFICL